MKLHFDNPRLINKRPLKQTKYKRTSISDRLTLSLFSKDAGEATISLVDALGKQLQQKIAYLSSGTNTITLDIHPYTAGIYYLSVQNKHLQFIKVIKR